MTLEELKEKGWIALEVLSGSRAYGLSTPTSDTDIHGVYFLPLKERLRYNPTLWVNSEKNDHQYWDIAKFILLLHQANPGALEMLYSPEHLILSCTKPKILDYLREGYSFLTKKCQGSFVRYAESQLKRARGLNKKVFNPMDKERNTILDFCYVNDGDSNSIPFKKFLKEKKLNKGFLALSAVTHMPGTFSMFYQDPQKVIAEHGGDPVSNVPSTCLESRYAYGIIGDEATANEVKVCSIPKTAKQIGTLYYNGDAYKKHCKEHREYWTWVAKRNDERYEGTLQHGGGYDAKNMMHVYRLLHTAKDIALGKGLIVDRSFERDFLLDIKSGKFPYDEIYGKATEMIYEVDRLFEESDLPEDTCPPDDILWSVLNAFDKELNRY
jgi:hypothetical protein